MTIINQSQTKQAKMPIGKTMNGGKNFWPVKFANSNAHTHTIHCKRHKRKSNVESNDAWIRCYLFPFWNRLDLSYTSETMARKIYCELIHVIIRFGYWFDFISVTIRFYAKFYVVSWPFWWMRQLKNCDKMFPFANFILIVSSSVCHCALISTTSTPNSKIPIEECVRW